MLPAPKANILLVDDNPANLTALRLILDDLGHHLVEARSGREALEKLQIDEFAVILLDLFMPELDGFDTAKLIRGQNRTKHLPIIFLTAHDIERSQMEEGYLLGAVDFLVKPLTPIVLKAKVEGFVKLFEEKQRAKREAHQLQMLIDGTTEHAIFMLDPKGYILTWNPGAERIKRYRPQEIIGQHFSRFYDQEAIDRGWPAYELQMAEKEGRFEDVGWRVRKDDTRFWANVVITALRDETGKLHGFSKVTRDMTRNKEAEENARRLIKEESLRQAAEANAQVIQEQQEKLQVTLASIGDAVISTDDQGLITFLNPIAEQLTAWSHNDATGRRLFEVFKILNQKTRLPVENPVKRVLTEGVIVGLANHTILIAKDGSERPIEDSAAPIRDAKGRIIGSVLVFRDVTEKTRLDRFRNARLIVNQILSQRPSVADAARGILQAIGNNLGWDVGLFWTRKPEMEHLHCLVSWHQPDFESSELVRDSISRTFRRGEGLPGRVWKASKPAWILDVLHDANFPRLSSAAKDELHGAFGFPVNLNGEVHGVIEFFSNQIREPDANILEFMETIAGQIGQFIERNEAEEQVRRSEQDLADFFDNATIGFHWVGPDGIIQRVNKAELNLLGYARHEYVGQHIANFHADKEVIDEILSRLQAGEILHDFPAQMVCKDGSILDVLIDSSVMWKDSEFIHSRCFTRDVTEQKRAVNQVRFQAHLLDTVGQAAIVTDPKGTIIYWNRFAEELFGRPKSDVIGHNIIETIVAPESKSQAIEIMNQLRSGQNWSGEFLFLRKNGLTFDSFVTGTPIFNEQGQLKAIMGVAIDISDRKRMERGLRFLADASSTLAALVDYQSTLQKVASLAVPQFADWCAVEVLELDGSLRRLAVTHSDLSKVAKAEELHRRYPPNPDSVHGTPHVLRTGQSEMMADIPEELIIQGAKDDEHLRILRELQIRSFMCVPLKVRDKIIGVISFVMAESGRRYTQNDLAIADELALRSSIAIENAQLYSEVREADRRQDEFLATLAHELRNPLAPLRNSLQVLKIGNVDAATAEKTRDMMERQVHHLIRLVDDLLDVSRVMRGKIELRKEPVELASVIVRAVETAQPLIEAQGHKLSVSLPPEALLMYVDPVRMSQIVGNLLTNAAKYTERNGQIQVIATQENKEAVLRIIDTGIGIAPEMLPHIFELFVQADYATSRSQGGLGIGLTLVKSLVEMHEGAIKAYSPGLGKGSEFVVRLPLATLQQTAHQLKDKGELAESTSSGNRLMVVDDNEDAAMSLAMLLRLLGHEVHVAHRGPEALEAAMRYRPQMIFLDIGMPGMDGYEVARRIRKHPELSQIVLVALTGWGQQEDRRRSAEAGFDHHLVKPPELKVLDNLLANLKPV